jgi:hypothetical protein
MCSLEYQLQCWVEAVLPLSPLIGLESDVLAVPLGGLLETVRLAWVGIHIPTHADTHNKCVTTRNGLLNSCSVQLSVHSNSCLCNSCTVLH